MPFEIQYTFRPVLPVVMKIGIILMTSPKHPCEFLSQILLAFKQVASVSFKGLYIFLRDVHDMSQK